MMNGISPFSTSAVTQKPSAGISKPLNLTRRRRTGMGFWQEPAPSHEPERISSISFAVPPDWTVLVAVVVSFGSCALLVLLIVGIVFYNKRRKSKRKCSCSVLNVSITGNWFHFKAHLCKNRDIFHSMVTGFSCYCFRAELHRWNEVRASQPLMVKRLWSDGSFGSRKVRTQSHISSTTSPENRRGRDNPSFQVHTGQTERNHTFLFHSTE